LTLTEVLKEREAQIELKKLIDQIKAEQENEIIAQFNAIQSEKDKKEFLKYQEKQKNAGEVTRFLKKQMQIKEEKRESERAEVARDSENIARLNEQFLLEKEKLAGIHRKKQVDLRDEYDRTLENKLRNKEAEQIIDEEENEEIRVYANAKKKMAIMKRQKELAILK
jgi:hypothetical protein